MPPRRKAVNKPTAPIGVSVFYPEQAPRPLPPPPREPSPGNPSGVAQGATSLSQAGPSSSLLDQNASSSQPLLSSIDQGIFGINVLPSFPPQAALRDREPQPSPSSHLADRIQGWSPPSELADRLQEWNLFTPSPSHSATRPQFTFGTGGTADTQSPISPSRLYTDLISERLYQETSPLSRPSAVPQCILEEDEDKPANDDDPFSRAVLYNLPPTREQFRGSGGDTFFGSPYSLLDRTASRTLPQRQLSWSDRRASSPGIANPISQPLFVPPTSGPSGSSSRQYPMPPPRSFSLPQVDAGDFYNSSYAATTSALARTSSSFTVDDSDLEFLFPEPSNQEEGDLLTAQPTALSVIEERPSEIAARYLRGRTLNSDFLLQYQLRDELGSGGFGFVCSAIQTGIGNTAGVEVAVKFIFKDRINEGDFTEIDGEPVESYVLKRCDHPGIIKFIALFDDEHFFYLVQEIHGRPWHHGSMLELAQATSVPTLLHPYAPSPYLASPIGSTLLPLGTLQRPSMARRASYDLFEAVEHRKFDEDQARHIFKQLVDAVQYMHSRGLYHRDLKDENIVMDDHLTVKIIDFGSAVIEDRLLPPVLHDTFRGTTTYASAEVLNGEAYHAGPADVWALGIILSIVLTGGSPFENTECARTGRMRFKVPISSDAEHLLSRCLDVHPYRRATIEGIAVHRWFDNGFLSSRRY